MQITQGSIVLANVVDPQGRNAKVRPLIVITATPEILVAVPFLTVAITGNIAQAADEVPLPWNTEGRGRTKLTKPCVAKCSWVHKLTTADVLSVQGHLPTVVLNRIMAVVATLRAAP